MIRSLSVAAVLALGLAGPASSQQPDMAAMQKWMASPNVTWHVTGKYEGDTSISSDGQGMANVTDTVEFDVKLGWLDGNKVIGQAKIRNTPSVISKLHDREPKCLAPTPKGDFDYATLDSVTAGQATALHFKMTTTFPDVVVSQVCTSTKLAPAKKESDEYELFIPQPTMLAMGISDKNLQVTPDKKSIVIRNASGLQGWTWTMTPTPG